MASRESDSREEIEARRRVEEWLKKRGVDHETAFGAATAGEQRNTPVALLSDYYEPGEFDDEMISRELENLERKERVLSGHVGEAYLDDLRRRRSALKDIQASPVPQHDHLEFLTWSDIQTLVEFEGEL